MINWKCEKIQISLSGIIANANQINIGNLLTNILQIPLRQDWITRFQLTWFSSLNFHLKISTKLFQMFQLFWHVFWLFIYSRSIWKLWRLYLSTLHFRCVELKPWLKSNNNCARLRIVNETPHKYSAKSITRQSKSFHIRDYWKNAIVISALFCRFDHRSVTCQNRRAQQEALKTQPHNWKIELESRLIVLA